MYTVYDVLKAIDYVALSRIVGHEIITGLPCPVIEHSSQSDRYGPASVYPPKGDDPGTVICHNCGENWSAMGLAKQLAVEKSVKEEARTPEKPLSASASPEPIDLQEVWTRAKAAAVNSTACLEFFKSRWGDEVLSKSAVGYVGWTADFKGRYFGRSHHLFVPAYDANGDVVTGTRRHVGGGNVTTKSKRLPNTAVGLERGALVWFGDPLDKVASLAGGETLWIAEGELDTLLLMALRDERVIRGSVIGAPGSIASSMKWWEATRGALKEPLPQSIVMCFDNDKAGDKYIQASAAFFPTSKKVVLPDGMDLTDVMAGEGQKEVVRRLNSARNAERKYYILDDGRYAYFVGNSWAVCRSRSSMKARLIESGYSSEEAASNLELLPPAADIVFDPTRNSRVIFKDGNTWLNCWQGLPIRPVEGEWELIYQLLFRLCGRNKHVMDYVLDWLAQPIQGIQRTGLFRNKTALVFYGAQGTGKGLFFDHLMRDIYGAHFTAVNHRNLEDAFDPVKLGSCLFMVANEVADSTLRDAKVLNILKSWVTDPVISIRRMRKAATEIPIFFNLVMTSNHNAPIRLEPTDRRYTLIRCDEVLREDRDLTRALILERESGWPAASHCLHHLMYREILNDVTFPMTTEWRDAMMDSGRPSQDTFALAICEEGFNSLAEDWAQEMDRRGRQGPFWRESMGFVPTVTISEVYSFWCRQHGIRHPVRSHDLCEALERTMAEKGLEFVREQRQVGRKRLRGISGIPMTEINEAEAQEQRCEDTLRRMDSIPSIN